MSAQYKFCHPYSLQADLLWQVHSYWCLYSETLIGSCNPNLVVANSSSCIRGIYRWLFNRTNATLFVHSDYFESNGQLLLLKLPNNKCLTHSLTSVLLIQTGCFLFFSSAARRNLCQVLCLMVYSNKHEILTRCWFNVANCDFVWL